jgi:predicted TIM-barrel fold metal-dependent hydrolase
MMKAIAKQRIEQQLQFFKNNADNLIVDADTHLTNIEKTEPIILEKLHATPNYYQGRPIDANDLLREMNMSGVNMSLVWQNPAATVYVEDKDENFKRLLAANQYIYETACKYPDRFMPAGWTDPKALGHDNAKKLVDILIQEFGFAIVKMNPAQNQFPISSDSVVDMVGYIISQKAIPAFHYGADTVFTPASGLETLAQKYPESPIIAIHMGGGGAGYIEAETLYHQSRDLGLKYPNIKYVLSAKRDTHIESDFITYQLAGAPYNQNLFCASDAPYGRQTWNFGGYKLMFQSLINGSEHTDKRVQQNPGLFTDKDMKNYMGGNFAKFMIAAYENLLKN